MPNLGLFYPIYGKFGQNGGLFGYLSVFAFFEFGGVYAAYKIFTFADGILAVCFKPLFAATLGASRTEE